MRSRAIWIQRKSRVLRENEPDSFAVGIVPVRETEAWVMADGEALRNALGVRLSDHELGVPKNPKDVEGLADPKKSFERACRNRRRSRGPSPTVYLPRLGETIRLEILDRVPAFERFRADLVAALRDLHIIA